MFNWLWAKPNQTEDGPESKEKPENESSPSSSNTSDLKKPVALSSNATGSGRNKVALKPGHSLMDWIKYTSSAENLSGTNGVLLVVSGSELSKHNSLKDCWVAVKGNVYNMSPYLEYHPGGVDELMKGAGKDATELFDSIHPWVNYEGMLRKCLVGRLKPGCRVDKAPVDGKSKK